MGSFIFKVPQANVGCRLSNPNQTIFTKNNQLATLQVTATRVNTFELYWQVSLLCRIKWILSLHAYLAKWCLGSFAESNNLSYLFKVVLIFCQIFLSSLVHPKCFRSLSKSL